VGIGKILKSMFSPGILGDEIVETQEKVFKTLKNKYPGQEQHYYLTRK